MKERQIDIMPTKLNKRREVYIDDKMWQKITNLAEKQNSSRSKVIRNFIEGNKTDSKELLLTEEDIKALPKWIIDLVISIKEARKATDVNGRVKQLLEENAKLKQKHDELAHNAVDLMMAIINLMPEPHRTETINRLKKIVSK